MKLANPWPDGYSINAKSPYGMRRHPISGRMKKHQGVDVAGVFPVTAAQDGVVKHIGFSRRGGGHVVLIDHGPIWTAYYHGESKTVMFKSQRVTAGGFIYTSGNTGASTGAHLHFEVRNAGGRWGDTLDPVPFFQGSIPVVANKVSGRLDVDTWRQFQMFLKDYGYTGRIDGVPGKMTYTAIQYWADVRPDGVLGLKTRKAVQALLKVRRDGVWGRGTIGELQRRLNAGTL